jgi:hypothetical protein
VQGKKNKSEKVKPMVPEEIVFDDNWTDSFSTDCAPFHKIEQDTFIDASTSRFDEKKSDDSAKSNEHSWTPQWDQIELLSQSSRFQALGFTSDGANPSKSQHFLAERSRKSADEIELFFDSNRDPFTKAEWPRPIDDGFNFSEWSVPTTNEMEKIFKRSRSLSRTRPSKRDTSPEKCRARSSSRLTRRNRDRKELDVMLKPEPIDFSSFKKKIKDEKKATEGSRAESKSNESQNTKPQSSVNHSQDAIPTSVANETKYDPVCVHTEVLEVSQVQALLGDDDDGSDFEEKWEKTKLKAPPSPLPALSSHAERNKKAARSKHTKSRRHKKKSHNEKEKSTVNKRGDDKADDKNDNRIGAIVEGLWDGVNTDSNGLDALADEILVEMDGSERSKSTETFRPDDLLNPFVPDSPGTKTSKDLSLDNTERTEDSTLDKSQSERSGSISTKGDDGDLSNQDSDASHATSALSSPEEEEELAYLDMLRVEEVERHDWFVHMKCVLENNLSAHRQVLATMSSEVEQVNQLVRYSYQAIDIYAQTISELCEDPTFAAATGESGNDLMMQALVKAYKAIALRLEEGLPALKTTVKEMELYKNELASSTEEIECRGRELLKVLNESEENVRASWGKSEFYYCRVVVPQFISLTQSLISLL